ncbi:MAG: ABC transporter ATP-binding protein [Clostridia bacterium]|nr:ABC transporter ATP-binding protein [Clostridia bacterium]
MQVLKILALIFLQSDRPFYAITAILQIIGFWGMFKKSGVDPRWALVPCARSYMLARCAEREPEGRVTSVAEFFVVIIRVLTSTEVMAYVLHALKDYSGLSTLMLFLDVVGVAVSIVYVVYWFRVITGLIEVYGVRRRWMVLWIFAEYVPALIWGWSDKYQPAWKVEDIREALSRVATSGSVADTGDGLTVNLKERTVTEFFQKKILLRDIHMNIPMGHMVLLLGGSGAGKTTFLNAVNGYEKADAQVLLNSRNLYKQYKKMQYEIGFVPQQELMRGKDSVKATLMDAARLRMPFDVPASERKQRVEDVMEIFGLKPLEGTLVDKLSGGQKKRVSIAMEFISNPSLFILDEPDSGLDGVMARELMNQLRKIADTGKIVIVITHTPDRVIDLFDDVIVLAKDSARTGRLAFYGSIEKARAFFGKQSMEEIVKGINSVAEGGEGRADEFIARYAEVQHG